MAHEHELRALVLAYLLPEGWRGAGDLLIRRFLGSQTQEVLVAASANGALVLVSVLLFPLKERLSAAYEEDARLCGRPFRELPLVVQGTQELKLLVLFVTAQLVVFRVGYAPEPWRKHAALVLSHGFLFFSFAVDFLSPVLQRHGLRYSQILRVLVARPILCFGFGALFALPQLGAGQLIEGHPEWGLWARVVLLFGATIAGIAGAVLAGTRLGARLLDRALAAPVPGRVARAVGWPVVLAVLGWHVYVFSAVGLALHHKSQILKCEYSVAWSSVELDLPSLGSLGDLFGNGRLEVGARLTVAIRNPTAFDVQLERNRLVLEHEGTVVATTRLSPLAVPAGQRVEERVGLTLALDPAAVRKGRALLSAAGWRVTLWLEVADGLEFPVYLAGG